MTARRLSGFSFAASTLQVLGRNTERVDAGHMPILEEHLVVLRERRESLSNQIEVLHEGDRKASMRVLLAVIDSQIAALQASGEASSRFMVQARF